MEQSDFIKKIKNKEWKNCHPQYLFELQKFLDKVDNIKDEELRLSIIYQMIKCDSTLTDICQELLDKQYNV